MHNVKTKQQIRVEQQFLYTLAQIIEIFPQYTMAQHISHFMRSKGDGKNTYFWSDETLLSKLEAYYDELKTDLLNNNQTDDEDYDG